MSPQKYDSIYLSGWEYNRLLQDDPLEPRNTGLSADILWNGGAPFWLFETVYCTKESLDLEQRCLDTTELTSSKIFLELAGKEGILKPLDWKELPELTTASLRKRHADLKKKHEDKIRLLINRRDTLQLENLKLQLLQPVMQLKGCVPSVSPSSLKLWKPDAQRTPKKAETTQVVKFLEDLVSPIDPQQRNTGIRLCNPPGTWVSQEDIERQNRVIRDVEAPMMSALIAGDEPYVGAAGHYRALEQLIPHNDAYRPINDQLQRDWTKNSSSLFRLRDIAKKHLWDNLHNEWLPNLLDKDKGAKFAKEFPGLLNRAIFLSPIANHLDMLTNVAFGIGVPVYMAVSRLLKECLGLPDADAEIVSSFVGTVYGGVCVVAYAKLVKDVGQLALFYQKARKVTAR